MAGLDGWEDLADDALNWALEQAGAAKRAEEREGAQTSSS
jgi:hypothetical protein